MREYPRKRMDTITHLVTDGKHGDCENKHDSGYFFLSSKDLRGGRLLYGNARQITYDGFIETHRRTDLKPGDILLANCGASIGRVGVAQDDPRIYKTTFQKSISVIKPDVASVDRRYLYYFVLCNNNHLIDLGGGTAQPNLLISDIKRIKVPLPPLPIQKKIAAILSAYDELIENNQRRIAILETMAEEIYREWFVRMRFPGHEKVKIVKGVPEGWGSIAIETLCDEIRDSIRVEDLQDDMKYLGLEHLPRKSFSIRDSGFADSVHSNKLLFKERDILFGKIRPYLHKLALAHLSGACSTDTIIIRPQETWLEGYLLLTFFSESFIDLATTSAKGTKMPRADWDFLKKARILRPDKDLLKLFQARFSKMFDQIELCLKRCELLKQSRDLLLPRLISGKLDVENLDITFPLGMRDDLGKGK
jgi:type I restriction enzyme, S subunit